MKNSRPLPEDLEWVKTSDKYMSMLDYARYFCHAKIYGITCGMFTGGGRCAFHKGSRDTEERHRIKKYSGFSKAYQENKGSEEVNED